MSHLSPPIIGSIVERSPASATRSKSIASPSPSGFPAVQHRSKKSAFARARESRRNGPGESVNKRRDEIPTVHRSGYLLRDTHGRETTESSLNRDFPGPSGISRFDDPVEDEWKTQMRQDNDRVIETMSEEERERHAAEIIEQLGPNVGELLRKAREARAGADVGLDTPQEEPDGSGTRGRKRRDEADEHGVSLDIDTMPQTPISSSSSSLNKFASPRRGILIASTPSSRASSPGRTARKLRFATVTPDDVHVFQSEPTTPRKPLGLLLPPSPETDKDAEMPSERKIEDETPDVNMSSQPYAEEGTPEDIRRRFFPHILAKDPALEWIESNDTTSDSEPRFDLSGALIPAADRDKLPTYLGLHHHGGSTSAGYTLSDLLLLARSSVPAQRATVLGVLSKLVQRVARRDIPELKDRDRIRNKALLIGFAALTEKGSVGIQAIDLVWSCVAYWDEEEVGGTDGVELRPLDAKSSQVDGGNQLEGYVLSSDPISSLPFPALLQQMTVLFDSLALPSESLSQLLSILHRFARHSVDIATAITESPRLVSNVVNTFLLTSIPPSEDGSLPNILGLDFLRTLALSSRTNARALEGPADAILRFLTTAIPLSASPFPRPIADGLLRGTLDLYTVLGRYGIYSSIATTAAEHFGRLSSSVLMASHDVSVELKVSLMHLLSVWMLCALDPHRTTPAHDILWSQVVGWGWRDDLLRFRGTLMAGSVEPDYRAWGAVCGALASWLEGCRVNSAKAGQDEREAVNSAMDSSWSDGLDKALLEKIASQLRQELSEAFSEESQPTYRKGHLAHIAELSQALADFARLCLACLPIHPSGSVEAANGPACRPWIIDAYPLLLSTTSALLSCNSLKWVRLAMADSRENLLFRIQFLHLRSASTYLASFAKLARFLSGGEEWLPLAGATLETLLPGDEGSAGWLIEEIINKECAEIECSKKLQFLMPFFNNMIRPDDITYLSPLSPTPESISRSTTQCLSAQCFSGTSSWQKVSGLPLIRDWSCITIDHLLRSGSSPILTNPDSVPNSWNASEKDLTQGSLSLMRHVQESLNKSDLRDYAPNYGHVVFNCMKVFMLEHNQQQTDSYEEVFRDATVGKLMDSLLKPYTLGRSHFVSNPSVTDLEIASKEFLGSGTPFFQFYTDFVALYDAISFSHSIFARLLLPPTSMAYAPDYRKLLWGDFGHALRTIRTPIEDVPTVDLKQYFWPVETDPEMLGWYLRALVKWPLAGFVRMIAVHHIACTIWSDLRETTEVDPASQKRARMLLVAIFKQAQGDVVKDVVRYVQVRDDDLLLPPECYMCGEDTKRARIENVRGSGETQIVESVEKIFGGEP